MPNLKVTINDTSGVSIGDDSTLADRFEAALSETLAVPRHATNVLISHAAGGPATAPIFIELIYRASPSRNIELMARVASALQAAMPGESKPDLCFRAFAFGAEALIAVDLPAPNRSAT